MFIHINIKPVKEILLSFQSKILWLWNIYPLLHLCAAKADGNCPVGQIHYEKPKCWHMEQQTEGDGAGKCVCAPAVHTPSGDRGGEKAGAWQAFYSCRECNEIWATLPLLFSSPPLPFIILVLYKCSFKGPTGNISSFVVGSQHIWTE